MSRSLTLSRRRFRSALTTIATTAVVVGGMIIAAPAPASATTSAMATSLAGSADLGTKSAVYDDGTVHADASVTTSLDWSQPALLSVDWEPNLVRQGRNLDPKVSYTRAIPGLMTATYSVSATGCFHYSGSCYGLGFGPVNFTASGPCELKADGAPYACDLSSAPITVLGCGPEAFGDPFIPACPKVTVRLDSHVTVTPDALGTLRTATLSDGVAGTHALSLLESTVTDPFAVPCTAGVGDELGYQLGAFSTHPGFTAETSLVFDIFLSEPIVPTPIGTWPYIHIASPSVPIDTANGTANISGAGVSYDLGAVQANNIAPVVAVAPSFSGDEGSPIAFSASATGPCAAGSSYKWSFSDGGHEFGAAPQHTFTDSGSFTGQVKVTDSTGLTDTADFTVAVSNLAPAVQVFPSAPTIAWGRLLTLQAQTVDPGAGDQATLTYAWDFADSSPVVTGGPSESHEWATPGAYDASVKVCDKDGGCTTKLFTVTVRKRSTSLGYTGDNAGTYSASTNLAGALVDEYGQAVNAATLSFDLGGSAAGTALTGASGIASRTTTVGLSAGSYSVSASFAGNGLYSDTGPATESYDVSAMGTSVAYTGSLSGGPNKVIPLSAKLTDNLGRPLAGRTITFVLGSQSASAVTGATGVAATTLQLNQKPGIYSMSASWSGDAGKYTGSSQSAAFSLNKK
jgi:hypothetical protein